MGYLSKMCASPPVVCWSASSKCSYVGASTGKNAALRVAQGQQSLYSKLKTAAFRVSFRLSTQCAPPLPFVVLCWVLHGLQVMMFSMSPSISLRWSATSMIVEGWSRIHVPVSLMYVPHISVPSLQVFAPVDLWGISAFLVLLLLIVFVWQLIAAANWISYSPEWAIRLLYMLLFVATNFFPAIMCALLLPFHCTSGAGWLTDGRACYTSAHTTLLLISGCLIPICLVAVMAFDAFCVHRVYDARNSKHLLCASHGRVAAMLKLPLLGVCCLFVFGSASISGWLHVLASGSYAVIWFASYVYILPYWRQWLNGLQCALAAGCIAASISSAIAMAELDAPHTSALWFFVVLFPALHTGKSTAARRWSHVTSDKVATSPFINDLRVRAIVSRAAAESSAYATGTTDKGDSDNLFSWDLTADEEEVDGEISSFVLADHFYHQAMAAMPTSALVPIFAAQYFAFVRSNKHLAQVYIRHAIANSGSAWDVRCFAEQQLIYMNDAFGRRALHVPSKSTGMTVDARMRFEALMDETSWQVAQGRRLILEFWSALSESLPSLNTVKSSGMRIVDVQTDTEANFKELLLLAPRSASLMRAYASFLLDVMNDPAKATEFLASAETIEDEQSHAHNLLLSDVQFGAPIDFDLSIDNLSLIRVSTDPEKLGIVTSANSAMLKTFGYQPREIIGHDVEMLFPAPFAEVHSQYLRNYVTTGDERLISTSRVYFGKHRSGHLVPIRNSIKPIENGTELLMSCEELNTRQCFVWFMGAEQNYTIRGVCRQASARLAVAPLVVAGNKISFLRIAPQMEDILAEIDQESAEAQVMLYPLPEDTELVDFDAEAGATYACRVQKIVFPGLPCAMYAMRFWTPSSSTSHNKHHTHKPHILEPLLSDGQASHERSTLCGISIPDASSGSADHQTSQSQTTQVRIPVQDNGLAANDRTNLSVHQPKQASIPSPDSPRSQDSHEAASLSPSEQDEVTLRNTAQNLKGDGTTHHDISPIKSPGSVVSKGSHGSSTGTSRIGEVLRHRAQLGSMPMEKSLARLNFFLLGAFMFVGCVNVIAFIAIDILLGQVQTNMHVVSDTADRAILFQQVVTGVQSFGLNQEGLYPFADDGNATQDLAWLHLGQFNMLHVQLYSDLSSATEKERILYERKGIPIMDCVAGTYVDRSQYNATYRNVSLTNAGIEAYVRIDRVLRLPMRERTWSHQDVFWVMMNGAHSVREAMNASVMAVDERSETQARLSDMANMSVLITTLILLFAVYWCVIAPSIVKALGDKQSILASFLDIPVPAVKAMRSALQSHIEIMRMAETGDQILLASDVPGQSDVGGGSFMDDMDFHKGKSRGDETGGTRTKGRRPVAPGTSLSFHDIIDGQELPMEDNKVKHKKSRKKRFEDRNYAQQRALYVGMLLKLAWPLPLFIVYTVGFFEYRAITVEYSRYARSEILWSKQVEFFSALINSYVRHSATICDSIPLLAWNIENGRQTAAFADIIEDALMAGDSQRGFRAATDVSPAILDLYTSNGCVGNGGLLYELSDCHTNFYAGVVGKGLHAGWKTMLDIARQSFDRFAWELQSNNCTAVDISKSPESIVDKLADNYLAPGLQFLSNLRLQLAQDRFSQFSHISLAATLMSLVASVGMYLGYYRREVRKMDRETKHCHQLLLVVPVDLFLKIPSMLEIEQILINTSAAPRKR